MFKKLNWILVLFFVLFLLSVFNAPSIADKIWEQVWITNISDKIKSVKESFDKLITHMPTKEEAEKAWENFVKWVDITKNKIDKIRQTLSWAEDKINEVKEIYDDTTEKIEDIKETINSVKEIWEQIQDITWWTWDTN